LNYEIGLSIKSSKLLWVNGPTAPGEHNDLTVFRNGLLGNIPQGKRAIGDKGYSGEDDYVSTFNYLDPPEVAAFKARVCARHETFNKRVKIYECLKKRFRHGVDNHKVAFEAICVLTVLEFQHSPLFDAWAGSLE
jgi:DDE superfamily endonuclease